MEMNYVGRGFAEKEQKRPQQKGEGTYYFFYIVLRVLLRRMLKFKYKIHLDRFIP